MSEAAKAARAAMKAKAKRMASEKDEKVDSSDWSPPEKMHPERKTGPEQPKPRAFKRGGKVIEEKAEGDKPAHRADRAPRSKTEKHEAKESSMHEAKESAAEEAREHRKHGGRAKKMAGGANEVDPAKQATGTNVPVRMLSFHGDPATPYKKGGKAERKDEKRSERAHGGRTKSKKEGKTHIHININAGGKDDKDQAPPMPMPMPPPMMPPARPPMAPPAPPSGMPPMPPMHGGGGGAPNPLAGMMARKSGGRVRRSYKDMTAGAGSGEGREQKTEIQKSKH